MIPSKKLLIILGLFAIGFIDFIVYWNSHLYHSAEDFVDHEKKIQLLQRANKIYPWNDRVHYELGKAYFASCIKDLSAGSVGSLLIQNSSKSFRRSLRQNPASPFSHFYYAQALLYENFLNSTSVDRFYKELKSAALLAGENRELLFEVGKRYFVRWKNLTDEDRDFVLDILKKALEWKPKDKFPLLMDLWAMNVENVAVMEKIMPDNPEIYRLFGNYLGEKSLSLKERHRMLSRADLLQLERCKVLLAEGEEAYNISEFSEAKKYFEWCLGNLLKIQFFHKLSGLYQIDDHEFQQLYKSVNLNLALSILKSEEGMKEARKYLHMYLDMERNTESLKELDSFLMKQNIDDSSVMLHLYHSQKQYQDIMKLTDRAVQWVNEMPDMSDADKGRILFILGDTHLKMGKIQEAAGFLLEVIEVEPRNLRAMLRMRQLYQDLDEAQKAQDIDKRIDSMMMQGELILPSRLISREREFSRSLYFKGGTSELVLYFQPVLPDKLPLISVILNGRVVWEDYAEDEKITLDIDPKFGGNTLRVVAVNHPFVLKKMVFKPYVN